MPYYVIPGVFQIFSDWNEASHYSRLKGLRNPKKFKTYLEASNCLEKSKQFIFNKIIEDPRDLLPDECAIYCDGSFDHSNSKYYYGFVILDYKGRTLQISKEGSNNPLYISARNVAGEVEGCVEAIKEAMKYGFRRIYVHHDYSGIQDWVIGTFDSDTPLSKFYLDFINDAAKFVDIKFIKVKGHSNIKYNELADRLAAQR